MNKSGVPLALIKLTKAALSFAIAFSAASAQGAPTAQDDLSGLGRGELAHVLSKSIFLGETTTTRAVERLANNMPSKDLQTAKARLEQLGFQCTDSGGLFCNYKGYAKSLITRTKEVPPKLVITSVSLDAALEGEKIMVKATINTDPNME